MDAWRFALQRHVARSCRHARGRDCMASSWRFKSELGIEFVRITATRLFAQAIGFGHQHRDLFWLAMLLEGQAEVRHGTTHFASGDRWRLGLRHRQGRGRRWTAWRATTALLIVKVPRQRAQPSAAHAAARDARHAGGGKRERPAILAGMLRSVADTLDRGDARIRLRPVELGLPEFLLASLLDNASHRARWGERRGCAPRSWSAFFRRSRCGSSDPELSLQQIAQRARHLAALSAEAVRKRSTTASATSSNCGGWSAAGLICAARFTRRSRFPTFFSSGVSTIQRVVQPRLPRAVRRVARASIARAAQGAVRASRSSSAARQPAPVDAKREAKRRPMATSSRPRRRRSATPPAAPGDPPPSSCR